MTKTEKLLEQARIDLDAINRDVVTLEAAKAEAAKAPATYAKWRQAVEDKTGERERLEIYISTLEADVEQQNSDAARADLASRRAALQKQTAALAVRISDEGAHAAAVLMQLAADARTNAEAVEQLNRDLPHDEHLIGADHVARHGDPAPRQDLEATAVDLWVFELTGELVGDPDLVRELSHERGIIPPASGVGSRPVPVVRKRFRQVRYLEAGDRVHFEPLGSVLRLPRFDAPGLLFDRGRALEPAPRRELLELIPAPVPLIKSAATEDA